MLQKERFTQLFACKYGPTNFLRKLSVWRRRMRTEPSNAQRD
jgi:hypothetical protein